MHFSYQAVKELTLKTESLIKSSMDAVWFSTLSKRSLGGGALSGKSDMDPNLTWRFSLLEPSLLRLFRLLTPHAEQKYSWYFLLIVIKWLE